MGRRDRRRQRREARDAELDRQDREAAARLENLTAAPVLAADGQCPDCGSRQFRPLETAGEAAARGFLAGGVAGAAVAANQGFTACAGCGKTFREG